MYARVLPATMRSLSPLPLPLPLPLAAKRLWYMRVSSMQVRGRLGLE